MNRLNKLILICILFLSQKSLAQITLEQTETNGFYGIVNLSKSGYKYIDYSGISSSFYGFPGNAGQGIHIRNLDGSLFRTLTLPTIPDSGAYILSIFYISETLFDTDSNNIEYFLGYAYPDQYGNDQSACMIVEETGAILLLERYAHTFELFTTGRYYYSVYSTDQGTKMQFYYVQTDSLHNNHYLYNKIFSLPGSYPAAVNAPLLLTHQPSESSLFPNPSSGEASIKLDLPSEVSSAVIVFYDITGQMIKQVKINPLDKLIKIDNTVLSSGTYLYQIITTPNTNTESKKMVIVK